MAIPVYDAETVNKQIESSVDFQENKQWVDPEKSTVSSQLGMLLKSDSPYIKEAERRGTQYAAKRGMLNSSIAAGASTREAIAAALPIAQQDAGTYATSNLDTQRALQGFEAQKGQAVIQGGLNTQDMTFNANENVLNRAHEQSLQRANLSNQRAMQTDQLKFNEQQAVLNREHELDVNQLQNDFNMSLEDMRNTQETFITDKKLAAEEAADVRLASNTIMANYQQNVKDLLGDPTFLELSGADLNKTLDNMKNMAKNQVTFVGSMSQVDLTEYLEAAFPTYTY